MEVVYFSETLVPIYTYTRCHKSEDQHDICTETCNNHLGVTYKIILKCFLEKRVFMLAR
jgi:hypothetical protein